MVRGALASLLNLEPDIEVVAQVSRGDEVLARGRRRPAGRRPARHRDARPHRARRRRRVGTHGSRLPDIDLDHVRASGLPAPCDGRRRGRIPAQGRSRQRARVGDPPRGRGERVVDPGLAAAALSEGTARSTPREHEVLTASRHHATVADLAQALYLSPGTVRNHLSSAMQKLDARNRAEAVRIAEEKGWL